MSQRSPPTSSLTRRDVVKRAVAVAALGGSSTLVARDVAAAVCRHRVAIIGASAGGITAAYFLAGTHAVDLFEARGKVGGHCDTHVIDYHGESVTVDLGAQFFHPDTHPIYVTLLEQLGLYDPAHPNAGETIEAPGSLCIFPTAGGKPRLFLVASACDASAVAAIRRLYTARTARRPVRHVVGDDG